MFRWRLARSVCHLAYLARPAFESSARSFSRISVSSLYSHAAVLSS